MPYSIHYTFFTLSVNWYSRTKNPIPKYSMVGPIIYITMLMFHDNGKVEHSLEFCGQNF